jgi:ubiquitin-conjugating enzyme E2 S
LIAPNPESALNEEAGKLLLENYDQYFKHAKLLTSIHAMKSKIEFEKDEIASDSTTGILTPKNNCSPLKRSADVSSSKATQAKKLGTMKKSLKRL